MEKVFQNYYQSCYNRTGFVPTIPLGHYVHPGDFFQINNGEITLLGNIYMNKLVSPENCDISSANLLHAANWSFHQGVTKPYSGRGVGENLIDGQFEYSRQVLAFDGYGSFFFKGTNPESVRINNWNIIADELIIKLTQTNFSFRDVYVVTETAVTSNWTLAICGSEEGELEIATNTENHGLVDLFGHETSRTVQSKEIEYYHREVKRKPHFFKAKKLKVKNDKLDHFISDLINRRKGVYEWASEFYDYNFEYDMVNYSPQVSNNVQGSLLDMLQANELNPNTALLYFKWADFDMDDISRLFNSNGR
jgi:hypothetical protein